jgi:CxxC motif-containing protein (DUF1111 family)
MRGVIRRVAVACVAAVVLMLVGRPLGAQTNLSQGKPATASSVQAGNVVANANDGSTTTRWAAADGTYPQWWRVDLGASANVTNVSINWLNTTSRAYKYKLEVSSNDTSYTTVVDKTANTTFADTSDNFTASARYVRVTMTGCTAGGAFASAYEIKVNGNTGPTPTATITPTATATIRPTATTPPTATPTPVPLGSISPLYDGNTVLEPDTVIDTPTALITRVSDRVRDRHARECQYHIHEHYIHHYWDVRTVAIEVVDKVAKGGTTVTFNITSQWQLNNPNLRTLFQGTGTVAQYYHNVVCAQVDPLHYTSTMTTNEKTKAPLKIGDRIELEFSPFLLNPQQGRSNYYGTAFLYVVGQGGMQPWQGIGTFVLNGVPSRDSFPLPTTHLEGGGLTSHINQSCEPQHLFKQLGTNSSPPSGEPFTLGRRLHHTDMGTGSHTGDEDSSTDPVYTEQIGKLGPHFYARTCIACHINNGRGIPPAIGATLTNAVTKVGTSTGAPDPKLGSSLQPFNSTGNSTSGPGEGSVSISSYTVTNGTYADGTAYQLRKPNYAFSGPVPATFSVRNTPQLVGMGLLEAVPESAIAALADPADSNGDGIRGRMQSVIDPQTGQTRLGRFGWKAGKARVSHQIASALNNDMGVTTSIFPAPDCGSQQTDCGPSGVEVNDSDLANWIRYISVLGVPARQDLTQGVQDPQSIQGESLFASARCTACHVPTLTTSQYHPFAELRKQTIHPYTDLLLHDMGPGLADTLGEGIATGAEWRTAPLWAIGMTPAIAGGEAYLHDGRARTIEEAILWHGGEGQAAANAFRNMSASDRAALVKFLKSI